MSDRAEEAALKQGCYRQFADGTQGFTWPNENPRTGGQVGHDAALTTVKTVHTLAWFSIESCMLYVLYTGLTGRSGRRAAIAASIVAGESLIFAANGFRCPLTDMAERLGAERGSVTDIYLPRWFAHNLPAIHAPLILLAAFLHRRNIRRQASANAEYSVTWLGTEPIHGGNDIVSAQADVRGAGNSP
jgi:hypothetical protein